MSKIKQGIPEEHRFETWSRDDQEQEDEPREVSNLLSFVVISLAIGIACGWVGILSGRI